MKLPKLPRDPDEDPRMRRFMAGVRDYIKQFLNEERKAYFVSAGDGGDDIPPMMSIPGATGPAGPAGQMGPPGLDGEDESGYGLLGVPSAATGTAGSGDVVGPASSTDNAVVRFDGTTGKLIQNSGVIVDDSSNVTPVTNDVGALGTTSLKWADLYLANGAVVNFNSGDITITHSSNLLAFDGADTYQFDTAITGRSLTGIGSQNLFLRSSTTSARIIGIQAYDVDGASYTEFITLTAANTPTCDIGGSAAGIGVTITTLNTGLHVLDTGSDHDLIIAYGENATADRTLTLILSNADRSLTIGANSSISGTAYVSGGTDVALADGGTGNSLGDPGADRILFWDDSSGAGSEPCHGAGLTITTTTLTAESAKCWLNLDMSGTMTVNDSVNVDSVTDGGVGIFTPVWTTDFATANYVVLGWACNEGLTQRYIDGSGAGPLAVGSAACLCIVGTSGAAADSSVVCVAAFGDQ